MRRLLVKTAIASGTWVLSMQANAGQMTTNLDLACQDVTFDHVYQVVVEPEIIGTIPEENTPIRYTGEYLATVINVSHHETFGETVYSGNNGFSLRQVGKDDYTFKSKSLNLDLTCSKNGTAEGTGIFSGTN